MIWTVPGGRSYTTYPTSYPIIDHLFQRPSYLYCRYDHHLIPSAKKEDIASRLAFASHNIGAEYLLLGILAEDSDTTARLNDLGVTKAFVQQELAVQFAKIQAERTQRAPEPES